MNFFKLYTRVLTLLGPEARLGWILAGANVALAAAQFAEPVLFGRIIDALVKGQAADATPDVRGADAAARRLGRLRPVHHRLQRAGRAPCRPAVASAQAGHRDDVFRARPAVAAVLSRRLAFRPADEGDAHRRRRAVDALAVVLPRAFRRVRRAVRAVAAVAVRQLAARLAAADPLRGLRRPDRAGDPQDRETAERGRGPLHVDGRTRVRCAEQHRAGAGLCARRSRGEEPAQRGRPPARRADAGAVVVGDDRRADALGHDPHHAVDLPARHLPQHARARRPSARSSPS